MINSYENIVNEFNKRNCKLLTTREEHIEILKVTKKTMFKLDYIASCSHNHSVFYNVFKSRGTGIICPNCKTKENAKNKKEQIKTNKLSKIYKLEQEDTFIKQICKLLNNDFKIIKAFDGCNVDIIYKPKNHIEDNWVGIQVKTTNTRNLTYSFHINNTYNNCLLLFYCCEDKMMWLIPENIILNQKKVSIGYNKSKYNIYKINKDNIFDKFNEYYYNTTKYTFTKLDTPNNIYQQREKQFRKYREEKIDFIKFEYDNMEGTVYDFKIGNLKIQEKVTNIKNNGKQKQIKYDIGDNDFYWLNCDNKKTFFVIPEKILINKKIIGNNNDKKSLFFKITIQKILHHKSSWLQPYMFDYENIDKNRLLDIIHCHQL